MFLIPVDAALERSLIKAIRIWKNQDPVGYPGLRIAVRIWRDAERLRCVISDTSRLATGGVIDYKFAVKED
jgi:hypothetical protein